MTTKPLSADEAASAVLDLIDSPLAYTSNSVGCGARLMTLADKTPMLSHGELVLFGVAHAVWNGGGDAKVADLAHIDAATCGRVLDILRSRYVGSIS
jgi:hypothetical protein